MFDLVETVTSSVLCLPQDGCAPRKGKEETYEEVVEAGQYLKSTINAMNELLKEILYKNLTAKGLDCIFKVRFLFFFFVFFLFSIQIL